jgi:predicted DNA-binding antitoxin AbrB/MazE fold protein
MQKMKGTIDRFEGEKAVIRVNSEDVIVPKKYLDGFSEGQVVSMVIRNEEEDTEESKEVAKALVSDLFKEE